MNKIINNDELLTQNICVEEVTQKKSIQLKHAHTHSPARPWTNKKKSFFSLQILLYKIPCIYDFKLLLPFNASHTLTFYIRYVTVCVILFLLFPFSLRFGTHAENGCSNFYQNFCMDKQ